MVKITGNPYKRTIEGSHKGNPKLIDKILDDLPEESFGPCINYRHNKKYGCKAYAETLGNGLCMRCWDKGTPTRSIKDNRDNRSMWRGGGPKGTVALDNDSEAIKTQKTKSYRKFI